jgi:acyl-CoA thioesterase FadM
MDVYKEKITAADCDLYEHMNTLKYMHKFYAAADAYLFHFGLTDPILAKKGIGCAYLEFNTKFQKEVFAGSEIIISAEIVAKARKVATLRLQMKLADTKEIVSEALIKFIFFDLKTRKSILLNHGFLKDIFFVNN